MLEGEQVPCSSGHGPLVLGADLDRTPAVNMQVAALLIYERALLPAELSVVQNYLQNKYFGTEF